MSRARKAEVLVKTKGGIPAMGYLSFTSAELVHIRFQQAENSGVCSLQVIPRWCLSVKWKSIERNTDWGQKFKFRNLKENLLFGTFRAMVLVTGGGKGSQDQGREPVLGNRQVGKLRLYFIWSPFDFVSWKLT